MNTVKTKEEVYAEQAARNAERAAEAKAYAIKQFGLKPEEVVGYNSGICYSKVWVTTREAAEKVSKQIKKQGGEVNGGMFHGMPLGGISEYGGQFEVMC
jgi:hypothetical protein